MCFLRRFQHYFSYITDRLQFTYSWSLGKQTSTRLENVPCPKALHHDRRATTGDWTLDTQFKNPEANDSTTAESFVLSKFYAVFNMISVISWRQFIYTWSLSKQTSTRTGNVPCPRALHHDRRAATGNRTSNAHFLIHDANQSTTADSHYVCCSLVWFGGYTGLVLTLLTPFFKKVAWCICVKMSVCGNAV